MEKLSGLKVLVTGANGFLGRHLIQRLSHGNATVHAISRSVPEDMHGADWHQGDLTDSQWVQSVVGAAKPDVIYHLAGSSLGGQDVQFILPNFESGLRTTVNTLLAAQLYPCQRVILAASLEEPILDGRPVAIPSPYAAAKVCATFYGNLFHEIYGVPVTILRPFMSYGPGQKAHKIVPHAILSLLKGEPPRVSSGARLVDWVYVEDVITAFVRAAIHPDAIGATIDLGSGELVSIREVLEQIHRLIPQSPAPHFGALLDRVGEVVRRADTGTAARILDWKATTSLTEGLSKTIHAYAQQLEAVSIH